jgi:hypothetical protein
LIATTGIRRGDIFPQQNEWLETSRFWLESGERFIKPVRSADRTMYRRT